MPMRNLFITSLLCLLLCSCSKLTVYQSSIQQGNLLNSAKQLQLGMTKTQVSHLLGTPVLTNRLASPRWDYVYTYQADGKPIIQQHSLTLYFSGDRLVKIEGPTNRVLSP
jgi:outer membrane protein assembly factor BamE